jgi:hypothetical protein
MQTHPVVGAFSQLLKVKLMTRRIYYYMCLWCRNRISVVDPDCIAFDSATKCNERAVCQLAIIRVTSLELWKLCQSHDAHLLLSQKQAP